MYDTLLTLPYEVKYIWQKELRPGMVVFLFARHPAIVFFSEQFVILKVE